MKWLITGGCGFLGTSLIRSLMSDNDHVIRVIDNLSVGTQDDLSRVCEFSEVYAADADWNAGERVQLVVADIKDDGLANTVTDGADVIVHFAANTGVAPSVVEPRMDCLTNVIGTFNYLDAARVNKVKRFVFASSGAPVGEVEPPIHEEIAPHPVSPYGASKLSGEAYCSAYYRTFGVETVALRFGNVYGPLSGKKNSVVAKFIREAMDGEMLEIYGNGNQTRDFVYIDDLVSAVRLAATKENVGGEIFQIATNAETTVNDLVEKMSGVLGEFGVANINVKYGESRLGDVMRNYSDTSKARKILGWQPVVNLVDGLKETIMWYLSSVDNVSAKK